MFLMSCTVIYVTVYYLMLLVLTNDLSLCLHIPQHHTKDVNAQRQNKVLRSFGIVGVRSPEALF